MTLGIHQRTVGDTQTWVTPRWILDALGEFDLDPAAANPRPWHCANASFTGDGLSRPWFGRVWLNPPFNRMTEKEVERLTKAAGDNRYGHRDATMVLIAFRHGLRASELCSGCPARA